jgi:hypothetical protein
MSVFEYIFSLYSLLLGLALAHLLSGLGRVVEARDKVRLGWPTALLALQMMLTIAIFWEIAWRARDAVPDNSAALFASLVICGLLYFGSVLIIPSDPARYQDLDAHFFKEKAAVLSCIFVANLVAYGWRYALMGWASFAYFSWADWLELGVFLGACAVGIFVKGRRPIIVVLTIMILLCLGDPVATLLEK